MKWCKCGEHCCQRQCDGSHGYEHGNHNWAVGEVHVSLEKVMKVDYDIVAFISGGGFVSENLNVELIDPEEE